MMAVDLDYRETRPGLPGPMGIIGLGHIEPVPGVAAHPDTYAFPTLLHPVEAQHLILLALRADPALYPVVLSAATDLIRQGARSILTTCGYFTPYQADLARALSVPVVTSPLLQLPSILTMVGSQKVLVLAANGDGVDTRCLSAAGVTAPLRLVVRGMEGPGPFRDQVLTAGELSDVGAIVEQTVAVARKALATVDGIQAICLECGDLSLAATTLRRVTGLPVFDYVTAAYWLYASSSPAESGQMRSMT